MKKLLFPALALLALASCNNEEIQNIDEPVAINFGQSLGLYVTKAPMEGNKLVDTKIGIWAAEYTGATATWNGSDFMDNEELTIGADGAITYTTTKYYSIESNKLYDFYAYSPKAVEGVDDNGIVAPTTLSAVPTLEVTLKDKAAGQVDILWANVIGNKKSANAVALQFNHALAQLVFKVQKEAGVATAKVEKITVNANSKATMSLTDGAFTSTGTPADFVAYDDAANAQEITTTEVSIGSPLMLFPETLTGDITFTIDGRPYTFTPTGGTLIANKITTITVLVKQSAISFSQSATTWSDAEAGNNGTGEIK